MILRISVYGYVSQVFDYLPAPALNLETLQTGTRLLVPFQGKERFGLFISLHAHSEVPVDKLKTIIRPLDSAPLFSEELVRLMRFAADYYHVSLGEVMWHALPKAFKYKAECLAAPIAMAAAVPTSDFSQQWPLNPAQQAAYDRIVESWNTFQPFLLNGVTGSGKTEIYLQLAREARCNKQSVLILIPEIGLTPQIFSRFQQRFAEDVVYFHSGLTEKQRFLTWKKLRDGHAHIVIGTRSALFSPLQQLGLIIVDEEHDASFKQEDRFRYHARDLAVMRAKINGIPIVLASATPSLESLNQAATARYIELHLPHRAGQARLPNWQVIAVKKMPESGLSTELIAAVEHHLAQDQHVLLFLNRRGYAPVWYCSDCKWMADCKRCSAHLVYHQKTERLCCHYCDAKQPVPKACPECASLLVQPIGLGTQRVEQALQAQFSGVDLFRIDRDSTQKKGVFADFLKHIHSSKRAILLGTQMLAKGHHFERLSMVGVIDADASLLSADWRAKELFGQLLIQVGGRSGRAEIPGEVYVQTRDSDNAYLQLLLQHGYPAFAKQVLNERKQLNLPPFSYLAIVRAEALQSHTAKEFLMQCKKQFSQVEIMGPVESWMIKRKGYFCWQLLLRSASRGQLQRVLQRVIPLITALPLARKVRWRLDVDPLQVG